MNLKSLGKWGTQSLSRLQDPYPGVNAHPYLIPALVLPPSSDTFCWWETCRRGAASYICWKALPARALLCFLKSSLQESITLKRQVSVVLSLVINAAFSFLPSLVLMSSVPGLVKPSGTLLARSLLLFFKSGFLKFNNHHNREIEYHHPSSLVPLCGHHPILAPGNH